MAATRSATTPFLRVKSVSGAGGGFELLGFLEGFEALFLPVFFPAGEPAFAPPLLPAFFSVTAARAETLEGAV